MRRVAVVVSGIAVVAVATVVTVIVWRASEPPAQGGVPAQQQGQQQEPEPPPPPEPRVNVGSDTTIEAIVLGEIYAQALDRDGFAPEHDRGIGGLDALAVGLESGEMDVVPAFSDTGGPVDPGVESAEMLPPSPGAKSEYVVVTTRANAERHGLSDVADLASIPEPVVGSVPADEEDPLTELWPRLSAPATATHTRPAGPGEAVALLTGGAADAVTLDSLEGGIASADLVILSDDENLVTDAPLYPAAVIRTAFADEHPEARAALEEASRALTTEDVRELVAATESNGGDPDGPVRDYYEREVDGA